MNKRTNKLMALLLAAVLVFALAAAGCGARQEAAEPQQEAPAEEQADSPEYLAARELLENGQFKEAIAAFEALGDYKDSKECILTAMESRAAEMIEKGTVDPAAAVLLKLLSTSEELGLRLEETKASLYATAQQIMEAGKYSPALKLFTALGDFEGSASFARYAETHMALDRGAYVEALEGFQALGDFLDSADLVPGIEQTIKEKGL